MVDNQHSVVYFGEGQNVTENEREDEVEETPRCVKLVMEDNIAAYMEGRELVRDIQPLLCDKDLVEKVISNYIIVKQILSNLSWQDKLICKLVCTTWHSAIQTLRKEQLSPVDFVIDLRTFPARSGPIYKKSSNFYNEPMTVFTFANSSGFSVTSTCKSIVPNPCKEPCVKEHCLLDMVEYYSCSPKQCMLTVRDNFLIYLPLTHSATYENAITHLSPKPFIGGLYIPVIPDVQFHTINIKSNSNMQTEFYDVVTNIAKTRVFKGVLVYVTDKYLLHSVEDIIFLNYFKELQPDTPYALGGCIVEDTLNENTDISYLVEAVNEGNDFISENLVSLGIFTIPQNMSNAENFNMYSFIIESCEWGKAKIQHCINEFAKQVPIYEHSAAIKLSCIGRDQKHKLEQDCFRAAFPTTRIIGCYGNGELGVNHPARVIPDPPPGTVKRHRRDPGPQFDDSTESFVRESDSYLAGFIRQYLLAAIHPRRSSPIRLKC